jgi:hypothetical protein
MDLACLIIEHFGSPRIAADFSGFVLADSAERELFEGGGPFW